MLVPVMLMCFWCETCCYRGDEPHQSLLGADLIVGSDLIFAKENIPLLLRTFALLTDSSRSASQNIIFAHINRFPWEASFFQGMEQLFSRQQVRSRYRRASSFIPFVFSPVRYATVARGGGYHNLLFYSASKYKLEALSFILIH